MKNIGFIKEPLYNYYISDAGHCRNQTPLRVEKIFNLYIHALADINDRHVKKAIESMAVVNIFLYAVPVIDEVKSIICSGTLKKYMLSSCLYKKTLRHALLMIALIILPYAIKKKLIIKHYTF